jgi:hypothetical protein
MRPSAEILAGLAAAGLQLKTDHGTGGNMRWAVWSRVNHAMYEVTGGFIDNEFDTQRRRGEVSTARSTF